jgi:hypothetical protein
VEAASLPRPEENAGEVDADAGLIRPITRPPPSRPTRGAWLAAAVLVAVEHVTVSILPGARTRATACDRGPLH